MKIPENDIDITKIDITCTSREIRTVWSGRAQGDYHGNPLVLDRLYEFTSTRGTVIVRLTSMPDDRGQVTYHMALPEDRSPTTRTCFASQLVPLGPVLLGQMYQAFLSITEEYIKTVEGDLSRE